MKKKSDWSAQGNHAQVGKGHSGATSGPWVEEVGVSVPRPRQLQLSLFFLTWVWVHFNKMSRLLAIRSCNKQSLCFNPWLKSQQWINHDSCPQGVHRLVRYKVTHLANGWLLSMVIRIYQRERWLQRKVPQRSEVLQGSPGGWGGSRCPSTGEQNMHRCRGDPGITEQDRWHLCVAWSQKLRVCTGWSWRDEQKIDYQLSNQHAMLKSLDFVFKAMGSQLVFSLVE